MNIRVLVCILLLSLTLPASAVAQEQYGVVVLGGRVMDPESGLDAVRHVGVRGGTIAAVSEADAALMLENAKRRCVEKSALVSLTLLWKSVT